MVRRTLPHAAQTGGEMVRAPAYLGFQSLADGGDEVHHQPDGVRDGPVAGHYPSTPVIRARFGRKPPIPSLEAAPSAAAAATGSMRSSIVQFRPLLLVN